MSLLSITYYNMTSDPIVANKTLTSVGSANGTFRAGVDVLRPRFIVDAGSCPDNCNYVYIVGLGRYYYVTGRNKLTSGLEELQLYVDVRKSFLTELKASSGIAQRNENNYNMYLPDGVPVSAKKALAIKKFSDTPFTNASTLQNPRYVCMLVFGGK